MLIHSWICEYLNSGALQYIFIFKPKYIFNAYKKDPVQERIQGKRKDCIVYNFSSLPHPHSSAQQGSDGIIFQQQMQK